MNQYATERLELEPCHVAMLRVAYTPTAGVQVQYEEKGALITGEAKAVEAELSKMRLFIRDIRTARLEGKSASFCRFLMKSSVGKRIRDCFDQERLAASFSNQGVVLIAFCLTQSGADRAVDIIQNEILEKIFHLTTDAKMKCTENERPWRNLIINLGQEFDRLNFEVTAEEGCESVVVVAMKDKFQRVVAKVADFIGEDGVLLDKFLPLDEGVVELLEKYGRERMDAILQDLVEPKASQTLINRTLRRTCRPYR